ncbi:MAG: SAM-dependent methyltransferase [Tetrasphaera sp.]
MQAWRQAWQEALYGARGFYRLGAGPAGHFATSCHGALGGVFAEAIARLAEREGLTTIVDVGAGRGELLGHLARQPGRAERLIGIDVVRPAELPGGVEWRLAAGGPDPPDLGGLGPALVIANEWLDVIPCPIAQIDDSGRPREVLVGPDGTEALGDPLGAADLAWAQRWWPPTAPGNRVEVGRPRDEALAGLLARLDTGLVVAIDYGHRRGERPPGGSLTGYRDGVQVPPTPDGTCDLTAHVAVDSLPHDRLLRQRDALGELGLGGEAAAYEMARSDPPRYLAALARSSALAALRGSGLGDFWWIVNRVG